MLRSSGSNTPQSMVIGFHGGNGIFTEALQPTGARDELLLGFDDPPPHSGYPPAVNTLWFGYSANLGSGRLEESKIEPYTLRRTRYVVNWAKRRFDIDRNRIYCAGTSFGAIGCLVYGLAYPQEIAAMWLNLPRYDFRGDGEELIDDTEGSGRKAPAWDIERGGAAPITARFNVIFGSRDVNIATASDEGEFRALGDGLGIYDRINFIRTVSENPGVDLPMLLMYHAKFDNVTGWYEKPRMVRALERARQPFQFYFVTAGHEFDPEDPFLKAAHRRSRLNQYVANQSLIAFQNASNNSRLGDGLDMVRCARSSAGRGLDLGLTATFVRRCIEAPERLLSGDRQGTINGYLDWNRNDVLDLSYRYEATLFALEAAGEPEATADVALRRLQNLRHIPGQKYWFENIDLASGERLEPPREIKADEQGRVIIPGVKIKKSGNRIILRTAKQ